VLDAPRITFDHPVPPDARMEAPAPPEVAAPPEPAITEGEAEPSITERPTLRAVEDDITGEFEPVSRSTRDELRDALADRFFDQGTFEDERWKPKA
jgi:hypothetical protein